MSDLIVVPGKPGKLAVWKRVRKAAYGYLLEYDPNRGKYVAQHRLVMERHLGREIQRNEVVHHLNGIRTDNRPENLEVMSWADHGRIHGSHRK